MHEPSHYRYLTFGYNHWKQLPIRIGTPGGEIRLIREKAGTVRIEIDPDGASMMDHRGEVETPAGGRQDTVFVLRLVREEVKAT